MMSPDWQVLAPFSLPASYVHSVYTTVLNLLLKHLCHVSNDDDGFGRLRLLTCAECLSVCHASSQE